MGDISPIYIGKLSFHFLENSRKKSASFCWLEIVIVSIKWFLKVELTNLKKILQYRSKAILKSQR